MQENIALVYYSVLNYLNSTINKSLWEAKIFLLLFSMIKLTDITTLTYGIVSDNAISTVLWKPYQCKYVS